MRWAGVGMLLVLSVGLPAVALASEPPITARVVTAEQRPSCVYLGLVSVRQALGPNKPGAALRKALRKTQDMGGNGLFLINQSQNLFDGAAVSGEALKCPVG